MVVAEGDRLHVMAEAGNSVLLDDQRSQVLLGPGASDGGWRAALMNSGRRARALRLDNGGAYADIHEDLNDGFVEIETPTGTARLVWEQGGSAMLVQYDVKAQELILACLEGTVALKTWNGTTWLSEGVMVTVDGRGGEQTIQAFEGSARPQSAPGEDSFDPRLWEQVVKNIE